MTLDINHKLATEVMGWTFEKSCTGRKIGYIKPIGNHPVTGEPMGARMPFDDWNPLQDRNHTALVLEKIGEMDAWTIQSVIDELGINPHSCDGGGEFWGWKDFWALLTAPPEDICKTLINVLDQEKGK